MPDSSLSLVPHFLQQQIGHRHSVGFVLHWVDFQVVSAVPRSIAVEAAAVVAGDAAAVVGVAAADIAATILAAAVGVVAERYRCFDRTYYVGAVGTMARTVSRVSSWERC